MKQYVRTLSLSFVLMVSGTVVALVAQSLTVGLEGTWQGTLAVGANQLRLVLNITKTADDLYLGTLISVDQGSRIPIDRIDMTGDSVRLELKSVGGTFVGTLNAERSQLKGTWTQNNNPLPLELTRAAAPANPPVPAAAPGAAATPPSPDAAVNPFGLPIDVAVPIASTPFTSGSKTHLVYELHITNFSGAQLLLQRIEVLDGSRTLATFEGPELNALVLRPGPGPDNRAIAPFLRAVAFMWITLDSGTAVPRSLRHRITSGKQAVEGGVVAVSTVKPVVLGPPLRGDWFAANGPANASIHRRAMMPMDGKVRIAQRFATDWLQIAPDGTRFTGDPKENKSYHAYGREVLSVANAVVVATKDGIPENIPGLTSRVVPIDSETVGGNYVILDLGDGRFAFYAHFQPGSLRVKKGDRVRLGQVLGLVGNSGNSTEPHLHFHVMDSNSGLGSEGLPFLFDSFELRTGDGKWETRRNELPLQNAGVRFPQAK